MAGNLRQKMGSYTWVTALMMVCNVIAISASYELAFPSTLAEVTAKAQLILA